MKTLCSILLLLVLSTIATACSPTPHGADDAPAAQVTPTAPESSRATELDTGAIGQVRDRYIAAVNDGDLDALMAFWAEDGTLSPPGQPSAEGREAIRNWYQGMFRQADADVDITSNESRIAGDMAFDRGTFTMKLAPKGPSPSPQGSTTPATGPATAEVAGTAQPQTFRYVVFLKREGSGDWKVAEHSWTPTAAAAGPAGPAATPPAR